MVYESESYKELLGYFDPIFTLLIVFSVLMIFVQLRFPMRAKHMLFVGAFTLLITFQITAIFGNINALFDIERTTANTVKIYSVYLIQFALIIWTFYKEKGTKKAA